MHRVAFIQTQIKNSWFTRLKQLPFSSLIGNEVTMLSQNWCNCRDQTGQFTHAQGERIQPS
jgi:hypothetical protein